MEHRAPGDPEPGSAGVLLPDNRDVPPGVYSTLGVDLFFSMWFVFLNNKVAYAGT